MYMYGSNEENTERFVHSCLPKNLFLGFGDPKANKCFIAFITHTIFTSHYSTSTRSFACQRRYTCMCVNHKRTHTIVHMTFDSFHRFSSFSFRFCFVLAPSFDNRQQWMGIEKKKKKNRYGSFWSALRSYDGILLETIKTNAMWTEWQIRFYVLPFEIQVFWSHLLWT